MSDLTFFSEHPGASGDDDDDIEDDEAVAYTNGINIRYHLHQKALDTSTDVSTTSSTVTPSPTNFPLRPTNATALKRRKMTRGKQKIPISFIRDRVRRCSTFSKRKTGLMKKAFELAELTGAEVMLLVASETNHVHTFTTNRLKPMVESEVGRELIQTCLRERLTQTEASRSSPPPPDAPTEPLKSECPSPPHPPPTTSSAIAPHTVSIHMPNGSILHLPLSSSVGPADAVGDSGGAPIGLATTNPYGLVLSLAGAQVQDGVATTTKGSKSLLR